MEQQTRVDENKALNFFFLGNKKERIWKRAWYVSRDELVIINLHVFMCNATDLRSFGLEFFVFKTF